MKTQEYFYALADRLQAILLPGENFTCWFSGEVSDFIRFNHAAIRQAGSVSQGYLQVNFISKGRQAGFSMGISTDIEQDGNCLEALFKKQRLKIDSLPEDPYLLISTKPHSSENIQENQLPDARDIVDDILDQAQGLDLVGIHAQGAVHRGFANSFGQRNWMTNHSFNLDFSVYHAKDKAVKAGYAGFSFDKSHLGRELDLVKEKLAVLSRPAMTLDPGSYRAYMTPSAFYDLISMLGWGALSEKALRTKQSALSKMRDEGLTLSPLFSLFEHTAKSTGPLFQAQGFMKPDCITLIKNGALAGSLISPRTAKEYGLLNNGSNGSESPEAYEVSPGTLLRSSVLRELRTGIFISNLWYLNYSDRQSARITGMTRFATFWVENGVIKAPLNVMRFDDSLYNILGSNLLALTKESDFILDAHTYDERSTGSAHLPGALVKDFNLTL
jgi:predicted Zn-dependent protease